MSATTASQTGVIMNGKRAALLTAAILAVALLAAPASAAAANAYGQTFAGQQTCLSCHGAKTGRWQVGTYTDTAHSRFITDVAASPSALVPSASYWPSPAYAGGLSFGAGDIGWMIGSPGQWHQYVTKYRNTGSYLLGSGQTLNAIAGPADDFLMPSGVEWMTDAGLWENTAKVSGRTYFQSCGGCHFLGVTRPTDKDYTLASGASVSKSTETSYTGMSIQCETCHGTGKAGTVEDGTGHWTSGVGIVRTKQALKSQTCGQCHVNGTAKEKNYVGGTFSSPNGFTTDRTLEDFFDVAGVQYIKTSPAATPPSIPTTDTKFYPNGSNKGMKHSFYNEWMLTPHARSLKYKDGSPWTPYAQDYCLPCHSGEGFLKSLGYGEEGPNDIGIAKSNLATDELNIECAVCHTVHAKTGEALGLRLEGEELCAKCHNAMVAEDKEVTAGTTLHHTQKEMREGYGLIGVARPAKRFMDETSCPQCHMPETKYTLKSHSFAVMLPGEAAEWNVQAKGDSCTPCHASKSREELQAELNEWKTSLAELTAEANSAIAAASGRSAATSAAGKLLIASAKTNVEYVAVDKSSGAHNYPYAKAGLQRASFFARSVGSKFTRFGATKYDTTMKMAMAYGTLKLGDGAAAAGQKVQIEAKANGATAWKVIGSATVGDDGDFGFAVGPAGTTNYRAVWTPLSGAPIYSATVTVTLGSSTSVAVSSSSFALGRSVRVSGTVSPAHAGKTVTLQYKRGTGSWRTLATKTLGSTSSYSHTWKPSSRGTYYVRTVFSGDSSHTGSTSVSRTVKVN